MMLNALEHYKSKWQLSEPTKVTATLTSEIYRVVFKDTAAILKILTPAGIRDEQNGALALRYFNGIGSAHLIDFDPGAHLIEYIGGNTAASQFSNLKDFEASQVICSVVSQLHRARHEELPAQLSTLEKWFQSLFNKSAGENCPAEFIKASDAARVLIQSQRDVTVLYGDIHHENIMLCPQRGWLAIDPKGLYGERTFDVANVFYNPLNCPTLHLSETRIEKLAGLFSDNLVLDYGRVLQFAHVYGYLKAAWMIEDGIAHDETLAVARKIGELL